MIHLKKYYKRENVCDLIRVNLKIVKVRNFEFARRLVNLLENIGKV